MRGIVILGAGYGGLAAALELDRHGIPFTLINREPYHTFKTLLHEVAGARHDPHTYALSLADLFHRETSEVVVAEVNAVRLSDKLVETNRGAISYGTLVVALGSRTATFGLSGVAEHAFRLDSLRAAMELHHHVERELERYRQTGDPVHLNVLVAGGGLTGVELMGEWADWLPKRARDLGLPVHDLHLGLIHAHAEILPDVDHQLRAVAQAKLSERGVELILNERVAGAEPGAFILGSGRKLEAGTLVWTGGVEAPALLQEAGLPVDNRNRVDVDEFLMAKGVPDVYVIGDCARFTAAHGTPLPPTGQVAEQMGHHLGANLVRSAHGRPPLPFVYHDHGMVASLGPRYGVAEIGTHHATGATALVLKDGSKMKYLMHLGGPVTLLKRYRQWLEI
ncbi:NAD(P)/FAD-dependent oxidoreductase [Alicyclobacillus mali]|uniref:NAD(P)/FAD-dependent oxidoreductase n=1 Tax=Alicyclobacillus mali (ex Roth et al. 2021) TaxID=1123961 RepID=A0ABS0F310_9BACL|nr:NAD(P)/FAD-dependent oxidoreductase [Alicyclobacillus mali (ex Roth et al. 2021)]MBF8377690.1 NAD(P)/FAD-dependent oxidoreductase [Alicyclobacillus mali (ex Roth et al. 2021)]MCL6488690.1 NAD(P)/FAD-dependent oxidoreductase [Alicyclobacillus mali (ex Roth et al. 2021)]